jgi:hypothetical protein
MKVAEPQLDNLSKDESTRISDLRVAAVLVFAIVNLAVFLVRLIIIFRYGELFQVTGAERLVIYPVWKAVHHLPVYDWPLRFPFALALYNYLFYYTYAFYLKLAGASGADILLWGRLFTPAFVIVGAIAQWKLVQNYFNLRGTRSLLSLIFSLGLWFCTSIVRQWAITIRPDMAAVALVMVALCLVMRQSRFNFVYAGVLFYLAWSFKQSVVLAFAAVCLFLLLHKRWRDLSVLAAVFATLAIATIVLGTPEYRFNVFVAPEIVKEFSFLHAIPMELKSITANAYWILAPFALLLAARARRVDDRVRLLITAFAVAFVGGLAAMAKVGAWDHYLLEAFAAGSTLLQLAVFAAPGRLASALVLLGCVQPAMQLALVPSGARPHLFGTVGIATAAEYADAVALRERLAPMKRPIFSDNEIFSLPWFSNDNRAPVLMVDTLFHNATRTRCETGCVEGMLQRGEIPTVMLLSNDVTYLSSLSPRYKKAGEGIYAGGLWRIYVLDPREPSAGPSMKQ